MVADEVLASTIEAERRNLERAADALVAAANARGGEDNITVVLFELVEAAEGASEDGVAPVQAAPGPQPTEDGPTPEGDTPSQGSEAAAPEATRHGAGPGGRIAALVLLAALLAIAVLALYTGINR